MLNYKDAYNKYTYVIWFLVCFSIIILTSITVLNPIFIFSLIGISIFFVVFLIKPLLSLYVLIALIIPGPSVIFNILGITLWLSHLFIIIVLLIWLLGRLTDIVPQLKNISLDQAFLFFWLWALISILWSHDPQTGLNDLIKLTLAISCIYLLLSFIDNYKTFSRVMQIFICIAILDGILALIYPYTGFYIIEKFNPLDFLDIKLNFWFKHRIHGAGGRCMGFFTAHSTAITLSFGIIFCMMLFLTTIRKKIRIFLLILALFCFLAIIGTVTKSTPISIFIGASYVILHLKPFRKRFISIYITLLIFIPISFFITRLPDYSKTFTYVSSQSMSEENAEISETSLSTRLEVNLTGLRIFRETMGIGAGIGGVLKHSSYEHWDGSHPAVLWELGFVGICLWCWFLLWFFNKLRMTIKRTSSEYYKRMLIVYLGGFIHILISWFVTFSYVDIYLWFYIGIGLVLIKLAEEERFNQINLPFVKNKNESIVLF